MILAGAMAIAPVSAGVAAPAECLVRFAVPGGTGSPDAPALACRDGDAACDADGVENGACLVGVVFCSGIAPCPAAPTANVRFRGPGAASLSAALAAAEPAAPTCTAPVEVAIERGFAARRTRTIRARASDASGRMRDRDRVRIACEGPRAPRAVIVATDFETGLLVRTPVAAPSRARTLATPVHADALVRVVGGAAVVVNRYLGDNVQVLNDRLGTRLQCSTGVGSNPHDIVAVGPRKAYVTRYDRDALWVVDPQATSCSAFRLGTIALGGLADGDGLPEMSQMAVAGSRLFVSLQRLDRRSGFTGRETSLLAVVDGESDTLVGAIELQGRNSFADSSGIQREPGTGKLLVPQAGSIFRTGDGGIERVDPDAMVSEGFVVTEDTLGGTIADFIVVSAERGYAIVIDEALRNLLVAFDPQTGVLVRRVFASTQFLADVVAAPDGTIWLADRSLPRPGIRVFDAASGEPVRRGTASVGLPPFSIGFVP